MFKEYVANAAILIAFVSISYQIFRGYEYGKPTQMKDKLMAGGIYGLLGILLMYFSIKVSDTVIIDLRMLALLLAARMGGIIPAVVAGSIIGLARFVMFGVSEGSLVSGIVLFVLTIVFVNIFKSRMEAWRKWFYSVLGAGLVGSLAFSYLIKDDRLLVQMNVSYCISLCAAGALLYFYVAYMDVVTQSYRAYRQLSEKDFLTGLNNVRQFDTVFNNMVQNVKVKNEQIALLYLDIDFFKRVNDTYGHKMGDVVLIKLGEILSQTCRNMDFVSRNGGEEFSAVLRNCSPQMAWEMAELIRKNVEVCSIVLPDKTEIHITISVGIATYPEPVADLDFLMEKADMALYRAKRTGRNKVMAA